MICQELAPPGEVRISIAEHRHQVVVVGEERDRKAGKGDFAGADGLAGRDGVLHPELGQGQGAFQLVESRSGLT